jgi:hypothetical protein
MKSAGISRNVVIIIAVAVLALVVVSVFLISRKPAEEGPSLFGMYLPENRTETVITVEPLYYNLSDMPPANWSET